MIEAFNESYFRFELTLRLLSLLFTSYQNFVQIEAKEI